MTTGAATVIFDDEGRVLIVKENYGKHRYAIPGGEIEPGESPMAAAVREAREETGAEIALEHLIGCYWLENGFGIFVFQGVVTGGTPALQQTDELSEVAWYPPGEVPHPRSNALHYGLRDALAGVRGAVGVDLPRLT